MRVKGQKCGEFGGTGKREEERGKRERVIYLGIAH